MQRKKKIVLSHRIVDVRSMVEKVLKRFGFFVGSPGSPSSSPPTSSSSSSNRIKADENSNTTSVMAAAAAAAAAAAGGGALPMDGRRVLDSLSPVSVDSNHQDGSSGGDERAAKSKQQQLETSLVPFLVGRSAVCTNDPHEEGKNC